MKTDLTTYGSMLQSQNKAVPTQGKGAVAKSDLKALDPKLLEKKPDPDYKLDLSKPSTADLPSANVPSLSTPELPKVEKPKAKEPEKKIETKTPEKIEESVRDGSQKRPLVLFIKGLDMFSSPSKSERGYAGVGKMAESIEGSRIYGWDQHDEIIKEIKKIDPSYPVVLVGHSLGGDTAVEIAEELDSLEHKFRRVDLLVTIDSVGADNDIISQNVKNHLNVFGERNFLLNDGPHVARRHELTTVKNILSPLEHTELDDNREIQFEVVNMIQDAISKRRI